MSQHLHLKEPVFSAVFAVASRRFRLLSLERDVRLRAGDLRGALFFGLVEAGVKFFYAKTNAMIDSTGGPPIYLTLMFLWT